MAKRKEETFSFNRQTFLGRSLRETTHEGFRGKKSQKKSGKKIDKSHAFDTMEMFKARKTMRLRYLS